MGLRAGGREGLGEPPRGCRELTPHALIPSLTPFAGRGYTQPMQSPVVIVTGASSGIGAASARQLATAGWRVVLAARRAEKLDELAASITAAGGTASCVTTDMRDEGQVEGMIHHALSMFGRLDALVNNAAVGALRTIADGRSDEWRAILETNVLGTLVACRTALQPMLAQGSGTILNVTSASAYEAWPYLSVYAGSKAAVHTISRGLRAEVAPKGVRVMTLEVHNVRGTDFASTFDSDVLPAAIQRWVDLGLLSRDSPMIESDDVARAVVFMLSQPDPVSVHHLSMRSRAN